MALAVVTCRPPPMRAHGPPRHARYPWQDRGLSEGVRRAEGRQGHQMAAGSPQGQVRACRLLPCALRTETELEMRKKCWLPSASARASGETSEVRNPAADEARALNRDMAVSLTAALHPLISRSQLLERVSPFARVQKKKSNCKRRESVLFELLTRPARRSTTGHAMCRL